MKESAQADVVKLLMDLSYLSAMIAVDIETDRAAGMERLDLEFEQLDDLLSQIDEQMFSYDFAKRAMATIAARTAKHFTHYPTPKIMQ